MRRKFEEGNTKKKDDKRSFLPRKDLRKTATNANSPGKIKKKKNASKKDLSKPHMILNAASNVWNVWKDLHEKDDLRQRNLERSNFTLEDLASTRGGLEGVSPPKQDVEV